MIANWKSDKVWYRKCDDRFIITTTFDYGRNTGCCCSDYFIAAMRNVADGRKKIIRK